MGLFYIRKTVMPLTA